jgi:hypothetical protein
MVLLELWTRGGCYWSCGVKEAATGVMEKRRLLLELWSRGPEEAAMELWSRGGYQWICGGEEAAQELWSKEDASIY